MDRGIGMSCPRGPVRGPHRYRY